MGTRRFLLLLSLFGLLSATLLAGAPVRGTRAPAAEAAACNKIAFPSTLQGLVDVAKYMNITTPEEDTGQTLGYYGMKPGPYVVLPFLPPFTLRDLVGYIGDIALNPINWMVFPIIEVNGIPSLVAHHNRTTSSIAQIGGRVEEILNDRSLNLEKFQGVEEATLDLYTAVKNAYIQKRRNAIRE